MAPMPGVDYTLVRTPGSGLDGRPVRAGSINGGLLRRSPPVRDPTVTIDVDDIDRAARAIERNGGRVVEPKAPIGDGSAGFAAYFRDTEGNVLGLFEPGTARPLRPGTPRARGFP
ncbi:MAG: VOC family protein [Thermoplasmata archaeon]